jgi:hypothetical protein
MADLLTVAKGMVFYLSLESNSCSGCEIMKLPSNHTAKWNTRVCSTIFRITWNQNGDDIFSIIPVSSKVFTECTIFSYIA